MLYEIVRWISISLCWVATALNIISTIISYRCSRKLSDTRKRYFEAYKELLKEKKNELYDKDCK